MTLIDKALTAADEFEREEEEAHRHELKIKRDNTYNVTYHRLLDYLPKVLGIPLGTVLDDYAIERKDFEERSLAYIRLENGLYLAATNYRYTDGQERLFVSDALVEWPGDGSPAPHRWSPIYNLIELGLTARRHQAKLDKAEEAKRFNDVPSFYQPNGGN